MRSRLLFCWCIFISSIIVSESSAAPPDGVTFITELFGYQGEYFDYSGTTGYTWDASLDVDADGDLWVCSTGRVFENIDGVWYDHTEASGGGDRISITSQGIIWIASSGHLASYDGSIWTDYSEGIPDKVVELAAEGDNIWMGCHDGQYNYFLVNFNGETVSSYHEGLLQNYIKRLTATPDGVWIVYHTLADQIDCTGDHNCPKGTSFFNGHTFHHHTIDNGMPRMDSSISFWDDKTDVSYIVYSSRDNKLYATCNGYLVTYDNEQWTSISGAWHHMLIEGRDGKLWYGNLGHWRGFGLSNYADGSWHDLDISKITTWMLDDIINGDLGPQVTTGIAETDDGILWFGVTSGLVRIDTKKFIPGTNSINVYISIAASPELVCYPNPFNNTTSIHFNLPETSKIDADIYTMSGQRVYHLSSGWLAAGSHALQWDGRNGDGSHVSSGMYIVTIQAENVRLIGSMTYVK